MIAGQSQDRNRYFSEYRNQRQEWVKFMTRFYGSQRFFFTLRLLALFFALFPIAGCQKSTQQAGKPNPRSEMIHDFGVVKPGENLYHTFVVSNDSDKPWRLARFSPTCTCSVVKPKHEYIKPGQSESFEFSYHAPGNVQDDRQSVILQFEGVEEVTVVLTVMAKIRRPSTTYPAELSFGQVATGCTESRTLRIENYSGCDWNNVSVDNLPRYITLHHLEKIAQLSDSLPRQVWLAEFRLDATGLDVGTIDKTMLIRSDTNNLLSRIRVVAHITDDISLTPTVINFGRVSPGKYAEAQLKIWIRGKHQTSFSPKGVSIQSDPQYEIDSEWIKSTESCWTLKLRLKLSGLPGTIVNGSLMVRFSNGIANRIVTYSAWINPE